MEIATVPPTATPQRNKALSKDYQPPWTLNKAWLRPYFWGGTLNWAMTFLEVTLLKIVLIIVWILWHPCSNFGHHLTCETNQDGWSADGIDRSRTGATQFASSQACNIDCFNSHAEGKENKHIIYSTCTLFWEMLPGSWKKTVFQNHKGRACWVMLSQRIHDFEFQRFQMVLLEAVFFSKNCPSQYLRFAGVFSPDLRCSSSLVPLEDLMSKCCQITHPGSRKIWRKWWFFYNWRKIPEDDSWGMKCSFLLLNWEVNKFGPWMVDFFCFHDCWKKSMQNLKELHHDWLLQIFINGHFNFCSKSWMFFSFRVPGMNRMVPSEESQTYMWFKKISDCFNDIGRLLTCLEILNGWSKKCFKFNFWGVSNFLCLTLQGVIWSFTTFQLHLSFGGGNHDVYAHLVLSDELDLSHPHWVTSYTSHATLPMETFRRHWHGSCHFGAPWQCFMTKSLAASWCQCLHVLVWKTWWNFRPDKPWQTNSSLNLAINLDVQIE